MTEKLQKILSRMGLGSRRGLEELIAAGRVAVNGAKAKIGDRFDENEITVSLDGKVVLTPGSAKVPCRVLMYHKPEGELTTLSDPEDRPTVFDHIPDPQSGRWIYIGRLDINTSGLLLFTTDGQLANNLMHPKQGIERVYAARVYGDISDDKIEKLTSGVTLDDGPAKFSSVEFAGGDGRNLWYRVTLKEGRKREVRRLWEAVGLKVSRLIRIKYAGIDLDPELKTGQFRELRLSEINKLRKIAGLQALSLDDVKVEDGKVSSDSDSNVDALPPSGKGKKLWGQKSQMRPFDRGQKTYGKGTFSRQVSGKFGQSKSAPVRSGASSPYGKPPKRNFGR